jgi:hypothetical protein
MPILSPSPWLRRGGIALGADFLEVRILRAQAGRRVDGGYEQNTLNPLTTFSQLNLQQRIKFQILKEQKLRVVDIAKELGVHHATVYREKIRNRTTGAAGDYIHRSLAL